MTINRTLEPPCEEAAAWFKGLADPHRLAIVRHLLSGEHRVTDLVDHLGLAQSTVSAHVAVLRRSGMIASHVHGRATFLSLAHPDAVRQVLAVVDAITHASLPGDCATEAKR